MSSFAGSMMLNYIRNIKGSFFSVLTLSTTPPNEIEIELKRAFKYVQRKLKQQHYKFKKM